MHTAAFDLRQQRPEFTIPDQRVATHQGDVQRLVLIDEGKHSRDEFAAFKVRKLAQLARASEMRRIGSIRGTLRGIPLLSRLKEMARDRPGCLPRRGVLRLFS
jgi:hypothetical protein